MCEADRADLEERPAVHLAALQADVAGLADLDRRVARNALHGLTRLALPGEALDRALGLLCAPGVDSLNQLDC